MAGKRFWTWAVLLLMVSGSGCCRWCQKHCCPPSCCYSPAASYSAPQPVSNNNCQPCCCVPCCCTPCAPGTVSNAPPPQGGTWQRAYPQGNCCQ